MIVVTGGAGFIGSNLVRGLNDSGTDAIQGGLVVPRCRSGQSGGNLPQCMRTFSSYRGAGTFLVEGSE